MQFKNALITMSATIWLSLSSAVIKAKEEVNENIGLIVKSVWLKWVKFSHKGEKELV